MNLLPDITYQLFYQKESKRNMNAVVLSLDIIGFTALTESFMQKGKEGSEIISSILDQLFEEIIQLIKKYKGEIINFAGDSITVLFILDDQVIQKGLVYPYVLNILNCTNEISCSFQQTQKVIFKQYHQHIGIKMGMAYGNVNCFIYNYDKHFVSFFRSEAINRADDYQKFAKNCELFIDPSILDLPLEASKKEMLFASVVQHSCFNFSVLNAINKENNAHKNHLADKQVKTSFNETQINKINSYFFPCLNNDEKLTGEFRDIVSIFLAFEGPVQQYQKLIYEILRLSDTYGAYFNKIDVIDNHSAILLIFGAPQSYEHLSYRVIAFIHDIKNKTNQLNAEIGTHLFKIKAGISHGTCYAGYVGSEQRSEYTCLGDTLNTAARLMCIAGWNQFLLTNEFVKLSDRKDLFDPVELLSIKGKNKKVQSYSLKEMIFFKSEFYDNHFTGRKKEMSIISKMLSAITKKKVNRMLYLYGEAGVGKSRLIYEIIAQYKNQVNFVHLYTDIIIKNSFNPVKSYLNKFFKIENLPDPFERNQQFELNFSLLIRQLSLSADRRKKEFIADLNQKKDFLKYFLDFDDADLSLTINPKDIYDITLYALKSFFISLSLLKSVCLIVEDLQNLDEDTAKLLNMISKSSAQYPFLILLSSRYKDDGTKIRIDLSDLQESELNLNKLSDSDLINMSKHLLSAKANKTLIQFIKEKSNNNPFYIEQIIYYLKDNDYLIKEKDFYSLKEEAIKLPDNINALIVSRIDRLSNDLKEIIQYASVIGREVDIQLLDDMLRQMNKLNENNTEKYIEIEKQQIWLLLKQLKYIFKHVLIQEAIYEMQLKKKLRKLHLLCAQAIEKCYPHQKDYLVNTAYHYEKAGELNQAKHYYLKSAEHFSSLYQNQKAIESYLKAIDMGLEPKKHLEAIVNLSKIYNLIGQKENEKKCLHENIEKARSLDEKYYLMRLKVQLANYYRSMSEYELSRIEYLEAYDIALYLNNEGEMADIIGFLGIIDLHTGKLEAAYHNFHRKKEICQKLNDVKGSAYAIGNIGVVHMKKSEYDLAMECYLEFKNISAEINDVMGQILALGNIGIILYNKGELGQAEDCFLEEIKLCKEIGDVNRISNAYNNIGGVYWVKSDLNKALKYYELDRKICEARGDKKGLAYAIGNMGLIHFSKNDFHKAIKSFTYWAKESEKYQDDYGLTTALSNLAMTYSEIGDYDHAIETLERNIKVCKEIGDDNQLSLAIGNLGSLYCDMGEFLKALDCVNYRLEIVEKIQQPLSYYTCYMNLSKIYTELKNHDFAMKYYQKAIQRSIDHKNDNNLISCLIDVLLYLFEYAYFPEFEYYFTMLSENAHLIKDEDELHLYQLILCIHLSFSDTTEAVKQLRELENKNHKDVVFAQLYYLHWKVSKEDEIRKKALFYYEDLYQFKKKYLYKKRVEELLL